MMFRPAKWMQFAPVVVLPLLAAWMVNGTAVRNDLTSRGSQALKAAGADWAALAVSGRDATVAGDAPSAEAIAQAVKAVAGTYGIRLAGSVARIVEPPPPPEMKPPTVGSLETNSATPGIAGTWPSTVAKTLTVTAGSATYVLGTGTELTASGDDWRLVPAKPIADGEIDVTAEVSDGAGRVVKSANPGHLVIDTMAPLPPVVVPLAPQSQPFEITGTWPEGDAVSLIARLAGKVWTLGTDKALASDGKGNWSLTPDLKFDPGIYDLEIEISDKTGNIARDASKDEITIVKAPEPAPPPPPPPEMKPPTVAVLDSTEARPVIKGTWPEIAATSLSVAVAGASYKLGAGEALVSDGIGNWSLTIPVILDDGVYDVGVESTDAAGKTAKDETKDELTIDAAGPASPTVLPYSDNASPAQITGTWDEANAKTLKVAISGTAIASVLTQDANLGSSAGNWALVLNQTLAPGSYDVVVETADSRGRIATDVTNSEITVIEPPPPATLKVPTVAVFAGDTSPPTISGTWDEGVATALSVAIPGARFSAVLGSHAALSSDGKGNWTLALPAPLAPGIYDVSVAISTAGGRTATDATTAEIYVKAPPAPPPPPPLPELKPPTIASYAGEASPGSIGGTWDEGEATALSVAIPGARILAALGTAAALSSDGKGNWTLALPSPLPPGVYDVAVATSAKDGRAASDATTAEIYIKAPSPPPPPPPPPPYDCEGALLKISAAFPILFGFNETRLQSPYDLPVKQMAALLNDPRCKDVKAEVAGHTDYYGGRLFNRALSELRAQAVADALAAAGVDAGRLSVTGHGKARPVDTQRNRMARSSNRRSVITIVK